MLYPMWLVLLLIKSYTTPITSTSVRLVNGTDSCSGRVEVLYDEKWGTVCQEDWDTDDAIVVCREVGCGDVISEAIDAYFGQGTGPVWMNKVECENTEATLIDCEAEKWVQIECPHSHDAGVICMPKIRLVNGVNFCSGRVEVLYNGIWGTVCDDKWDLADAAVVCRELGCGDVIESVSGAYFGQGSGSIWKADVNCVGNELRLDTCAYNPGTNYCNHSRDAGVICHSSVRLANGSTSCSGRVEVFYDGQWGTVCSDEWGSEDAAVVCREVGCGDVIEEISYIFGHGLGPVWIGDMECDETEPTLRSCLSKGWGKTTCGHEMDIGIICNSHVRLQNGNNICSGRVEVFRDNQWGTVCDDNWDLSDAAVVCRELGCGEVIEAKSGAYFGPGSGPVLMKGVKCAWSESTLMSCASDGWIPHQCAHTQDAGVTCRSIKVVNGPHKCSGTIQVLHDGQWGTVCDTDWDITDASVMCRELGCFGHVEEKLAAFYGPGEGQTWMNNVQCLGHETSITMCNFGGWGASPCVHEMDAGVACEEQIFKVVLRMEVKADSAIDPNDETFMKLMLDKIEEELQIDGNFSLSWRSQPNGNVFQIKDKITP